MAAAEEAMYRVLRSTGLEVNRQVAAPVWFRGEKISSFFADLVINKAVIVELKAARVLEPCHEAQLLNYLRGGIRGWTIAELRTSTRRSATGIFK